ncbi:MAG TPA: hypothetical protein VE687_13150, partial [Stellaceae bacterium]|nr:hypothetical protein [Stellaceae bacterium]
EHCWGEPSMSAESQEPGLWLWRGEAPPTPPPLQPASGAQRVEQIIRIVRLAGWVALPSALTLTFLAASVMLRSTPPDERVAADPSAIASQSGSSSPVARPVIALPQIELAAPQLAQVQAPSVPPVEMTVPRAERRWAKRRPGKTHLWFARKRSHNLGLLMPEPMTWHGGGY